MKPYALIDNAIGTQLSNDLAYPFEVMLSAVHEAGCALLKMQQRQFAISTKANNELVTEGDLLVNDILKSRFTKAYPDYGWLSEESLDREHYLSAKRVWIVDPIDGTKEFASGVPEYAISVALVEGNQPILAAVYNPATKEYFSAIKGMGAFLNGERIYCEAKRDDEKLLLLASRTETARGEWQRFSIDHEVKAIGSIAYKLGLIAAGRGTATFSLGPKNEWDIAAGTLLVTEAGGKVTNKSQAIIQYCSENHLINGIIATAAHAYPLVCAVIQE